MAPDRVAKAPTPPEPRVSALIRQPTVGARHLIEDEASAYDAGRSLYDRLPRDERPVDAYLAAPELDALEDDHG